jgi:glycosyltransferase involved in cell wall biosynthesis
MKLAFEPHVNHYTKGILKNLPSNVNVINLDKFIYNIGRKLENKLFRKNFVNNKIVEKYDGTCSHISNIIFNSINIDLAHINHARSALHFLNKNKALLITEHGFPQFLEEKSKREYNAYNEVLSLQKLNDLGIPIITISKYSAEMLKKKYDVNVKKVIYHGVLPEFKPKKELVLETKDKYRILYVSRLTKIKRPDIFLKAINIQDEYHKKIKIVIRGDGPLRNKISNLLGNIGMQFVMIPRIKFSSMPKLYRSCDIFIHTNPTEGFGLSILEAMASGLPIIVPISGGADEIAGKAGLRFTKNDPKDLAVQISKLIDDKEVYIKQKKLSLERAKNFKWTDTTSKYFEIYKKIAQ